MLIAALLFAEVFCLCAAAFFLFRVSGNTFAESASYAIITVFMLLSFIRQISFITGIPVISTCIEIFFLIASFILIFRHRSYIFSIFDTLKSFGSANPIPFIFLILCFLYIAIHVFLPVPKEFQNEFSNITIYEKSGFFSLAAASEFPGFLPVNHRILFNTFLRFGTDSGAGIFCFLAYLSIGFSTYALARRYSWQSAAFTPAILVMSMPRLVVQTIYPGTQIISVAVVLFCILAIYRTVELPNLTDLILLILGIFFCISENISSMIFAPILFVLSCVVLFRRHGVITWKSILGKNYYVFFAVVPAVIFSQCWLFLCNHFYKDSWSGVFSTISFNNDGIQGALANFIRYILESFYFTASIDIFFERVFNWSMAQTLQSLYDFSVRPFWGESGAAQAFHLTWMPNEMFSFGPVGFFLVLPALFYAMVKGPRRLKAVATAFFVYFYLVSLIIAWAPGNAKFFELFYVCGGFSIAFFFPPWRFTKRNQKIFQTAGCFLLFFTLLKASWL
ncbi:hypothetical protein [Desulfobacula sp.]|uniref:hypothetical protein n=1 Tax=Desulfobacula sp. TaxID=2593537 RepID=UPI0026256273|nr:hypothetical protein [Desulfobacula sp.]